MKRMPDATVILTMFGRSANWPAIRTGIKRQSAACEIWVWDNRGGPKLRGADAQFISPRNLVCWPRWFLATQAPTDVVIIADDDLFFSARDVVSSICDSLAGLPQGALVGAEGVALRRGHSYWPRHRDVVRRPEDARAIVSSVHVHDVLEDMPVDIVKGRCIGARRVDLGRLPMTLPHADVCDDIAVSGFLSERQPKSHLVPATLCGKLTDFGDSDGPMSLQSRPGMHDQREAARRHYFP
jgi:hypothetical protein